MKILVCGGRDFADRGFLETILGAFRPEICCLIQGGARGADVLAKDWAIASGIPVMEFPALWSTQGRNAGPKRNQAMLDFGKPDRVIAFPGGRGTADMTTRAKAAGLTVIEVAP